VTVRHDLCRLGVVVKGVSFQGVYVLGSIEFVVEMLWTVNIITALLCNVLLKLNTLP